MDETSNENENKSMFMRIKEWANISVSGASYGPRAMFLQGSLLNCCNPIDGSDQFGRRHGKSVTLVTYGIQYVDTPFSLCSSLCIPVGRCPVDVSTIMLDVELINIFS